MVLWPILLAFASGLLITVQGVSSSVGSKIVGTPVMIFWLSLIQAVLALSYVLFSKKSVSLGAMMQGWKWYLVSGLLGVAIVAFMNYSIAETDALLVFVLIVLGQIIGSALADQIGLFGTKVHPMTLMKAAAILVILIGTGLLYYADYASHHNYAQHVKKG